MIMRQQSINKIVPTIYNGRLTNQFSHLFDNVKQNGVTISRIISIELIPVNQEGVTEMLSIGDDIEGHIVQEMYEDVYGKNIVVKFSPFFQKKDIRLFSRFLPEHKKFYNDRYVRIGTAESENKYYSPTTVVFSKTIIASIKREK